MVRIWEVVSPHKMGLWVPLEGRGSLSGVMEGHPPVAPVPGDAEWVP